MMADQIDCNAPGETFRQFVAAINRHEVEALTALMTPDHLFLDSLGNRMQGAASMRRGWTAYFAMCPDYRIQVSNQLSADDIVLATGEAGGTIDDIAWRTPAAWRATIHEGRVAEWQVFADNKPVYEILACRTR
jgi:ketosteroid isomerase-like protein